MNQNYSNYSKIQQKVILMMINFDYLSNIFCIIIHQIYSNDNNGQGLNFLATHH